MTRIAEYRDIPADAPRAKRETLASGKMRLGYSSTTKPVKLVHISEGWACAGSMARYDAECWAVLHELDGAEHGRRFSKEEDARALFDKWNIMEA